MENQRFKANDTHNSKFKTYLTASEYFLQQRNFEDCRNYALKAIEIDSNQISPSQILAIANVLLLSTTINEDPNYYSILNLPLYTQNPQLIKTHLTNVTNLLNPNKNRYPFASEAFGVVLKAWSVISNPTQKTRFDNGLKNRGEQRGSFWTVCPYCYYVYEFLKDYEDCCLRCQNEYHCFGFTILGNGTHPFVSTRTSENNVESGIAGEKTNEKNNIFVETNGVEVDTGGDFKEKRIKMVGKSLNKVLGKGNKVNMNDIVYNDDFENIVEFFMGDDIYVRMQEEFDIGSWDIVFRSN
ncbi:hypothetical protein R3W88_028679 [Solanum pinnatisectum]|uniref:J domain-containing protein n=1 Tax=Solanum pinnatisectum TaxID=50273 RepID=A0AAV9K3I0_9SOLN|nr:hypothetical protein R3W88_028679 [Solanum pinnatisectum]